MELEEIRDYVFPINIGKYTDNPIRNPFIKDADGFLGNGFFIAKNGLALTAAHCLPKPEDIPGKSVCAGLWDGKHIRAHNILSFIEIPGFDIAIMKVDNIAPKHLELNFIPLYMGMDLATVGIPLSSITPEGIGFRALKGYVTFVGRFVEVSFPAPRGMSGSPVFYNGKVIGVISGNAKSEYLEDQLEEISEIIDIGGTRIVHRQSVQIKSIVNYGQVELLLPLRHTRHEMFDAHTFEELLQTINVS
jgi:hypothetical protein